MYSNTHSDPGRSPTLRKRAPRSSTTTISPGSRSRSSVAPIRSSAHDVADGGLAVTLAESAIAGGVGVSASCDDPFSEGDGRVVISARAGDVSALAELAGDLPLREIGRVGGDAIVIDEATLQLGEATQIWESTLPQAVEGAS